MLNNIYKKFQQIHNKGIFFLIYSFLFAPFLITYAINQDTNFKNPEKFLFIFVSIITILSFLAIISVYYYNFFKHVLPDICKCSSISRFYTGFCPISQTLLSRIFSGFPLRISTVLESPLRSK